MSEERKLYNGETAITCPDTGKLIYIQTSREWAADILETVARDVRVGMFPDHIEAFDVGRALGRAFCNSTEESPDLRVVAGLLHWQNNRAEADKLTLEGEE